MKRNETNRNKIQYLNTQTGRPLRRGKFISQINGAWYGPWAAVTAGEDWVCAVRLGDGIAKCRGWSASSQAVVPAEVSNASWHALSAGFQHTCGVAGADKRLVCWGSNLAGESSVPSARDAGLALPAGFRRLRVMAMGSSGQP